MNDYTAELTNEITVICTGANKAEAKADAMQQAFDLGQEFLGSIELLDCSIPC